MNRNKRFVKQLAMKGENKKCFECGLKSTPYVIMDFGVFVCTKCSGIHRNFQHKVKGISMTNFKDEDIKKLKFFGGNEEARKKWRAKHDPKKYPFPKPNDEYGIRKFVDQTFIAKRWASGTYDGPKKKPHYENTITPPKKKHEKRTPRKNTSGRKKKPFRKADEKKDEKPEKDPFGDHDPFDKNDPFEDGDGDWFEDFPDNNEFSEKMKTPVADKAKKPAKKEKTPKSDGGGLLLGDLMSGPTPTQPTQPAQPTQPKPAGKGQAGKGEFDNEWFDIEEKKNKKSFPDLDKLFGQTTPPKMPTGPSYRQPNPYAPQPNPYAPKQPNPYTPPQQPNPYAPTQHNPYTPPQYQNPYAPQQPTVNRGPVNPYAPQPNPYAPANPYALQMNPSNPFLVHHQPNPNNPFLNTPPARTNPSPNVHHPKPQMNPQPLGGGLDMFMTKKPEVKKPVDTKPKGPDPFQDLLMGI